MTTAQNLTNADRRQIVAREIRNARREIAARNGGHLSGQQQAAAKGIGRKRAMQIIDSIVMGQRHSTDCRCGCGDVEGIIGSVVQDNDTPKLATLAEPMLIAEFQVPSYTGGPSRTKQVAYSFAELGR